MTPETPTPDASTKAKLTAAAFKLFGAKDPSDVSVRQIAGEAGVNLGMISYHFGSKEGLYLHVVETIAAELRQKVARVQQAFSQNIEAFMRSAPDAAAQRRFCAEVLKGMMEMAVRTMLETLKNDNMMFQIIAREQIAPSPAFAILYDQALEGIFHSIDDLLRRIDTTASEQTIKLRAHALYGQTVIFVVTHATVTRRLGETHYTDDDIEAIAAIVKEHTDHILRPFCGAAS